MRLTLTDLMAARITAAALADWIADYGLIAPSVMVGYQRQRTATGWPYVALVPTRERRDLIEDTMDAVGISLYCGIRADDSDPVGSAAIRALDALSEAVLSALTTPSRAYTVGGWDLVLDYADLDNVILEHPYYEIGQDLSLRLLGRD